MEDSQTATFSFKARYPRLAGALFQVALGVLTLYCEIVIWQYGTEGGNPSGSNSPSNTTAEGLCEWGVEENIDSPLFNIIFPRFIGCPTIHTFIGACIVFVTGTSKLLYLNRKDKLQSPLIMSSLPPAIVMVDLHRILVSLRQNLVVNIWVVSTLSPLVHLIGRKMGDREGMARQGDPDGSIPGEPRECTAPFEIEIKINEQTSLIGNTVARI